MVKQFARELNCSKRKSCFLFDKLHLFSITFCPMFDQWKIKLPYTKSLRDAKRELEYLFAPRDSELFYPAQKNDITIINIFLTWQQSWR